MTTYAVDKEINGQWMAHSKGSDLTIMEAVEIATELANSGVHARIVAFSVEDGAWTVANYAAE